MPFVLDVALPALVVFIMILVGLELTFADFSRVLRYPGLVAAALISQWIILPVVAVLLIRTLVLPPVLAAGVILVAAAPIAAMSNYYSLLAGANLALAVTLTAVSSILAMVATPTITSLAFGLLLNTSVGFELPVAKVLVHTLIGLLLPIMTGMAIRHVAPAWVSRQRLLLRNLSLLAVVAVGVFVIIDQYAMISAQIMLLVVTSVLFTLSLLLAGWLAGWIAENPENQRAILFGFPARNLAFATLIAVSAVGRVDIASFAAVFFLVQIVLLVSLAFVLRGRSSIVSGE
ncbi:MAG: bile acid:sodium symporter family protein [Sphingomonadaceae bacterium]